MILAAASDEITLTAVVGWAIAVLSAAVGWWRNRGLRQQLTEARDEVRAIPNHLVDLLGKALAPPSGETTPALESTPLANVGFLDVTNDGDPEILIERGVGAHSSLLTVMGKASPLDDIDRIGDLFNDTGASFHVVDWDDDGLVEIRTLTSDHQEMARLIEQGVEGVSMANGPFVESIYRWSDEDRGFLQYYGERWPFGQPPPPKIEQLLKPADWPIHRMPSADDRMEPDRS